MTQFPSNIKQDQNFNAVFWYFWPHFDYFKNICAFHHTGVFNNYDTFSSIMIILCSSILAYRIKNDLLREWFKAWCLWIIEVMFSTLPVMINDCSWYDIFIALAIILLPMTLLFSKNTQLYKNWDFEIYLLWSWSSSKSLFVREKSINLTPLKSC